ncbi:TPA_asm: G [Conopholis alphacytorhabdovirus 1]|nr:TPA_asm: G [Conopholis alphacytorhabdovirus 1]
MSFFVISTILSLVLFAPLCFSFNHTIGPLARCNSTMGDPREIVEQCLKRCNRPQAATSHGTLTLYSEMPTAGGPPVVHCSKIKITQTFTETWSLSQIAGSPTIQNRPLTVPECRAKIRELCPDKRCNIRAPSHLTPEYHYASDTTLESEFYSLISMPSSIDFLEDNIKITPLGSSQSFKLSDEEGTNDLSAFIWDSKDVKTCPFISVGDVGCDYYDAPVDAIECRGSRIAIGSLSKSKLMKGVCAGFNRSVEGIIYEWKPTTETIGDNNMKKAFVAPVTKEKDGFTSLQIQINRALAVIDEDLCQVQCELLDIVSRINLGRESLLRLGNSYVVISKTGYMRHCSPVVSCHLDSPISFCGNPVRVSISCDGNKYLWNPLKSFIEDNGPCHKLKQDDRLQIALGNHLYDVDSDLRINASDSEFIGLPHDILTIEKTGLQSGSVDITELRNRWKQQVESEQRMNATEEQTKRHIDHWDISMVNLSWLGEIPRLLFDLTSKVYFWTIVAISVVISCYGVTFLKRLNANSGRTNNFHLISSTSNPDQPKWI